MFVKFNPVSTRFKSVAGGVCANEITVFSALSDGEELSLVIRKDGGEYIELPAKKAGNCFTVNFLPKETGLYYYRFKSGENYYGLPFGGRAELLDGSLLEGGGEFMLTVFSKGYDTPKKIKGGVIYQIFPDRFKRLGNTAPRENQRIKEWGGAIDYAPVGGKVRNDDFFGGTLEGIRSELDYLKSLGVTLIYLNPIFEARSNHRYDTGDYMKVDGLLGTEEDLKNLFDEAKEKGVGIVLDGVFNHTGDDSVYFNKYENYPTVGAYNSKRSQYFGWYNFRFFPDDYESWWGVDILPQINESSPTYREYICGINGVLRHYLRLGASGWRLDVVDELPDDFVKKIRASVKAEGEENFIVGEVWEHVTDKISYGVRREYFAGKELDSAMNYPLKNSIINYILTGDTAELAETILKQIDCYPKQSLNAMMNILGTHDTPRIINVLSGVRQPETKDGQAARPLSDEEKALGKERLKIAAAIEFCVYGVPTVYYGDEQGMTGWGDPFCRGCFRKDPDGELYEHYKKLGEIRASHSAFIEGETEIVYLTRRAICFKRAGEEADIYLAVNFGAQTPIFKFTAQATDLLSGETATEFAVPCGTVRIIEDKK